MAKKQIYGVDTDQEIRKEKLQRDIRSTWQKFFDALKSKEGYGIFSGIMFLWLVIQPAFWPIPFLIILLSYQKRVSATKHDHLPMRMPGTYNGLDYNNPAPTGGFKKAAGMFYIGNDVREGGDELWICKDDILTHMLVLGTTGAGKTETLVSLCFNYLAVGSGFIYVDPKAAPKLAAQIYTMCRILGRDDDFLVISYMADKKAEEAQLKYGHKRTPVRLSNTQNPFAVGDANQLTQLLFALMPGDDGGGNSIFQQNAQALISGLMFVLVEMRNKGEQPLSIEWIRHYLNNIPAIDELARRKDFSETASLALQAGLSTVGWDKSKAVDKQSKNFPEQYSYARAYFGRALSLLVDNYGRIFKTSFGEVDTVDVITSRRIYLTLIPSMDKDPKELKSLGQICLASVRSACGIGLGDKIQGDIADVLGSLPTDAKAPYGIIVDEYAAIETPGFEILLTQGRGLGMAVIVASQDMAGIKRASEAAAEQIVSNCKVKIFMTTEDPNQTYELIQKLAGEALTFKTSGYSINKEGTSSNYFDNNAVSAEKMSRTDFRDLQQQIEGQCHVFFKGRLIRGKTFYAAPPLKDEQQVRLACQLKCQQSSLADLAVYTEVKFLLDDFMALALSNEEYEAEELTEAHPLKATVDILREGRGARSGNDLAIAAFCAYADSELEMPEQEDVEFPEPMDFPDEKPGGLNARLEDAMREAGGELKPEKPDTTMRENMGGEEYEPRAGDWQVMLEKERAIREIEKRAGGDAAKMEKAAELAESNFKRAFAKAAQGLNTEHMNSGLTKLLNEMGAVSKDKKSGD